MSEETLQRMEAALARMEVRIMDLQILLTPKAKTPKIPGPGSPIKPKLEPEVVRGRILAVLVDGACLSGNRIYESTRGSRPTVLAEIRAMAAEGILVREPKGYRVAS